MKINEQIREHRKMAGFTQEQVAAYLGVSASAVNKWERGSTYPDITLLPVLARLLKMDMNTLFSFEEELTDFELGAFLNQLVDEAMNKSVDSAFERADAKIREYPHCDRLIYNAATVLEGCLILSAADHPRKKEYEQKILSWYEQAADSTDENIRCQASCLLAAKYINAMEYAKAEEFIRQVPDFLPFCDKPELQAKLLLQQGDPDGAAVLLQHNLVQKLTRIQSYLQMLIDVEEESGNDKIAEQIADIAGGMTSLFGLWEYGRVVPHLVLTIRRRDTDNSVRLFKEALEMAEKPWDFSTFPLYHRITGKAASAGTQSFIPAILKEAETSAEYDFLRGNAEFQKIIERYR